MDARKNAPIVGQPKTLLGSTMFKFYVLGTLNGRHRSLMVWANCPFEAEVIAQEKYPRFDVDRAVSFGKGAKMKTAK